MVSRRASPAGGEAQGVRVGSGDRAAFRSRDRLSLGSVSPGGDPARSWAARLPSRSERDRRNAGRRSAAGGSAPDAGLACRARATVQRVPRAAWIGGRMPHGEPGVGRARVRSDRALRGGRPRGGRSPSRGIAALPEADPGGATMRPGGVEDEAAAAVRPELNRFDSPPNVCKGADRGRGRTRQADPMLSGRRNWTCSVLVRMRRIPANVLDSGNVRP